MQITFELIDERMCPGVVCDICGQRIYDAQAAMRSGCGKMAVGGVWNLTLSEPKSGLTGLPVSDIIPSTFVPRGSGA